MTFCKTLAEVVKDEQTISAVELWDKFDAAPHYEIYLSRNGIVYDVHKTAKTTWKRKFKELTK